MTRSIALALAFSVASVAASTAHADVMQGRTDGGRPFVVGGVGNSEQQQLLQMAPEYSLQLVMATGSGNYVADTSVRIRDAQGNTVFSGNVDGPWLMVDLPAGRYTIEASAQGEQVRREIDIPASGSRRLYLHFKE